MSAFDDFRPVSAFIAATLLLLTVAGYACAQDYPVKPVRIIVPFAPGGPNDLVVRPVAQKTATSFSGSLSSSITARALTASSAAELVAKVRAGRLYAARHLLVVHDQREHLREAAVRSDARFRGCELARDERHHLRRESDGAGAQLSKSSWRSRSRSPAN